MTFSVVAFDRETKQWGVGVASKFISVGSVVPWVKAGTGAIATQAWANISYGSKGLKLLEKYNAEETVKRLTEADSDHDRRQLGIVDSKGNSFTYTGAKCLDFAGGITGEGYAVQGNILAGRGVIEAMAKAMEQNGTMVQKILNALKGAEGKGGDKRGKQSAAILIASTDVTPDENSDRVYDLRVDEHPEPVKELSRICEIWEATFFADEMLSIDENRDKIDEALERKGYNSLSEWAFDNNFDENVAEHQIGKKVLKFLLS